MREYYLVSIENVVDINRENVNFLQEMYPDLYELFLKKEMLYLYEIYNSHKMRKKINLIDRSIAKKLDQYHLPEYLIFQSTNNFFKVKELLSKEEFYFTEGLLRQSRVTKGNRYLLTHYLNKYSPEEIVQVVNDFHAFGEKNRKGKIITFSKVN